jgi:HEAT repeat protein
MAPQTGSSGDGMTEHRINEAAAFMLCIVFLMPSCSKAVRTRNEAISASLKSAIKQYESPVWTERHKAVKDVNSVIISAGHNTFFTDKDSKPYAQIAQDFLLEASFDVQPAVRIEAIIGLSAASSSEASERLRKMVDDDIDPGARWSALKALAYRAAPESAEVFAKAYLAEDWLMREAAIAGLLSIEQVDVKKKYLAVIERAVVDKNISVRTAALSRLNFTDPRLNSLIVQNVTGRHLNNRHTKAALSALNGYRLDDSLRKKIISDYLTHEDPEIRLLALKVLKTEKNLKGSEP